MDIRQKNGTAKALSVPFQTLGEEIANAILHGVGVLLGILALVLLVRHSRITNSLTVVYVIFAAAMITMFLASTLYHAIAHGGAKKIFRIFDHQAIYLFIAGTYTPFCLLGLKGVWGWTIFGLEWALAITGITLYATGCRFVKKLELGIFILMGWAVLAGCVPLVHSLSLKSLLLLLGGGLAYTAGTFWYKAGTGKRISPPESPAEGSPLGTPAAAEGSMQKIKRGLPGAHVVWHVFVLAGAVCHFFSIWFLT
jgi:hemolysin III